MNWSILWTILLLIGSNICMTFAWYGHLKLQEMHISDGWPVILVILFSWGIAFFEYCLQVPANRIGSNINGGPFTLMQLKVIQEVISLTVFSVIVTVFFKGEALQWNHIVAFACLILAVFFVFLKERRCSVDSALLSLIIRVWYGKRFCTEFGFLSICTEKRLFLYGLG